MNDIRSILKLATRRLETASVLRCLNIVVVAVGGLIIVMLVSERVGAALFWPWLWLGPLFAVLALLVTARMWSLRRQTELQVAVEVDQRLDLREKLSTSLHVAGRDDPFARAAIEDAVHTARNRKVQELLRRRFEVGSPPRWWITPGLVVLAVVISFIDPLDLFTRDASADPEVAKTLKERDEAITAVIDVDPVAFA